MDGPSVMPASSAGAPRAGLVGHLLVAVCACLLTVAIAGSGVFLVYRLYVQRELRVQVRAVVDSLQNRTSEELAERIARVRTHPRLASLVLPEVLKNLKNSRSEQQQCSAIQVLRVFVNDRQVEKALFKLRRDGREDVAAAAVAALGDIRPPERAAEVVGRCLEDVPSGAVAKAVVDEACAALVRLGEPGRREMQRRLGLLSVDRRIWLVTYVSEQGAEERRPWLEMLRQDGEARVRSAADEILSRPDGEPEAPQSAGPAEGGPGGQRA